MINILDMPVQIRVADPEPTLNNKKNPDPNSTLENLILTNIFFFLYKSQYNWYIIGIYQGLIADLGEADSDPDPSLKRNPGSCGIRIRNGAVDYGKVERPSFKHLFTRELP